jgi:hypothetical protein
MKLTFLGTRGEIDARTRRHLRHASLLASYAPQKTRQELQHYTIKDCHLIKERTPVKFMASVSERSRWNIQFSPKRRAIAAEQGVEMCIAYDGMRVMM